MEVFLCDLRRTTRRGRLALVRSAYATGLLIALGSVYAQWFPGRLTAEGLFAPGPELRPRALAQFAQHFAGTGLLVQLGAVVLLTPAAVAGAIVEERQRGTLDLLLTTDLTGQEIVAGKLAARGLFLLGVLLTGLPVLALTFLFGGIEPRLLAAGFGLTVASLAGLGGLSLLCSVLARTVTGAVTATYGLAAVFYALTALLPDTRVVNPFWMIVAIAWSPVSNASVFVLPCCVAYLGSGLAFMTAAGHLVGLAAGPLGGRMPLAEVSLANPSADLPLPPPPRYVIRPRVGNDPLLWKELHFGGRQVGTMFRAAGIFVGAALFATTFVVFGMMLVGPTTLMIDRIGLQFNPIFRFLTVSALGLAVLGVTVAATGGVSRERERQTLDGLLTLPCDREELLWAQWRGSVRHVYRLTGGLLGLVTLAVCTESFHVLAFPLLLLAGAVHAGFGVSLGVYLSVARETTARAVLAAILCLLAVCLFPPLAANFWDGLAGPLARSWPWVGALLRDGLSPPFTWWRLTVPAAGGGLPSALAGVLSGLAVYAVAGLWLWHRACQRLEREG